MEKADCKFTALHKEQANRLAGFTQSTLFLAMLVAVVTALVFIRVLSADFVMWDDNWCIYENPNLGPLTLENLRLIFNNTTVSSSWYTPLTGLRWCITYQFCRLEPFGYHFGNWLFHIVDAVLLFLVLRKLLILGFFRQGNVETRSVNLYATIGALIWSLHPMRVEVVAWAANAYGQALMFLLISLLCYLRANEQGISKTKRKGLLVISLVSFLASLLTQPLGLGFLVVLFVLDVYPFRRIGGKKHWWKSPDAQRVLLEKLPFIFVALTVVLLNIFVQIYSPKGGHRPVSLAEFGLFARFMQAMYILAYYIWRPWYPFGLSPVYTDLVTFNPWSLPFLFSGFVVISGTVILWRLRERWPAALALWVCHLALLIPALGLTDHPYYPNDRYSVIVSITFSVLLAALLVNPKIKRSIHIVLVTAAIMIIMIFGTLTVRQTRAWDNSIVLFRHIIRNLGDDPYRQDIHWRLGFVYSQQGNISQAIEQFQKTLEINPYNIVAHHYLAQILTQKGRINEAVIHYKQILQIQPNDGVIMARLAWLLSVYKDSQCYDPKEAIRLGRRACELTNYNNPAILHTLAAAYAAAGRYTDAITTSERALNLVRHSPGQEKLIEDIQSSLQLYKSGQPYIKTLPNPEEATVPQLRK
jgi:Tfp pilus assembly protein PilF